MRFALLLLTISALAQSTEFARIEGRVLNDAGEPVSGAIVTLRIGMSEASRSDRTPLQQRVLSDRDGRFQLNEIQPGNGFLLMASHREHISTGYASASTTNVFGVPFALRPGEVRENEVIRMDRQAVITGRITDQARDPVSNAPVVLLRSSFTVLGREWVPVASAIATELGDYRIADIPKGRYILAAFDPREAADHGRNGSARTFFPNAPDAQGAAVIEVSAGQSLPAMDIRLRREALYSISGTVVDRSGSPVADVQVSIQPVTTPGAEVMNRVLGERRIRLSPAGAFTASGLPPGDYRISLVQGLPIVGETNVTLKDQDVEGVVLLAGPGAELRGRLIWKDATEASPPNPNPAPGIAFTAPRIAAVRRRVQADGTFTAKPFAEVPYVWEVSGLASTQYISAATLNTVDVLHAPLPVFPIGSQAGPLEITISTGAAVVTGVVTDANGNPRVDAPVSLWPVQGTGGIPGLTVRSAQTREGGVFRFESLPPGEYYVAAWDRVTGAIYQDAFLASFSSMAERLTLNHNGSSTVQLHPIPASSIQATEDRLP